ncbi:hypothetical protein SCL_1023 [Sulfuricaulis limicola]|uniref:Uncharacterized protein n=1 Tax=Sulfuricaulis limicola TaxID=1620215 RepID=A0A1B4XEW0_9GAMM|nr:hypothetical protein [Sulfuricaulis limicola]BAV33338.1 hypothetical protein SCL_1023 [Sulfuricaulis limicola]
MMHVQHLVAVFVLTALTSVCMAYERNTHREISTAAIENSTLQTDPDILKNLGLKGSDRFRNSKNKERPIFGLIEDGADFEDGLTDDCESRPRHHFYDPAHDQGLRWGIVRGEKSPDWALEDKGDINEQEFSYKNARGYFYQALTSTKENDRKANFGLTFQSLGHVIHHIQDMAQPQHVRNDIHIKAGENCWYKSIAKLIENPSLYEHYTDDNRGNLPFIDPDYNQGKSVVFTAPRKFWTDDGKGLAEFTNRNFVSVGTNYQLFNNLPVANAIYPRPVPLPGQSIHIRDLLAEEGRTTDLDGYVDFIANTVADPVVGDKPNSRSASVSIFDQDLKTYNQTITYNTDPLDPIFNVQVTTDRLLTLNRFNFKKAHDFLIPRAVAYSAGLVDYFFRGKLEAEDVTFTDTGISLRVKNAIDPQKTPAWANEVLYSTSSNGSAGSLVVAFDYQDSAGKTQYGVSNTVSVRATDTLAPGQVSTDVYDFTLSVPPDAKNVNYRLIFRGKLGQEEDAVAVGVAEQISGFLVTPNYLPTDGITGQRAIFKQGGQWRLSEKKNLLAGNIDWKGWYVNGKPTKVLTWHGPKARYFPNPSGFSAPFTPNIFQNGELFSVAPHDVFGAALMKDSDGKEWLIAICMRFGSDIVYRRPNVKSDSPALYDPVTAKDGWQEIGRFLPDLGWNLEIPWFFNGDGTAAQTMRRKTKYIFDDIGKLISSQYDGLDRAKIEIVGNLAERTNLGNYSGITVTSTCERKPFPSENCLSYEVSLQENQLRDGKYIMAVDYLNNQEILAVLSDTRSGMYDYSASRNYTKVNDVCSGFEQHVTSLNVGSGASSLAIGSRSYDLIKNDETWLYRIDSVSNFYTSSATAEVSYSSVNERNELHHVDLRYGLLTGRSVKDSFMTAGSASSNRSDFVVPTTLNTGRVITQEVKSNIASQLIFESSENTSMPFGIGASLSIHLDSCGPVGSKVEYPDYRTIIAPLTGSWVVDGGENLLITQEYTGQNGAKRNFNYLTGGDLYQLIQTAPEDARYYPSGVIK